MPGRALGVLTGGVTLLTVPEVAGLPDFAHLDATAYRDATRAAMAHQRTSLQALAASSDLEPGAVIAAWELAGVDLERVTSAFYTHREADTNDEFDALAAELAPQLAAHADAILLDPSLYTVLTRLERLRADGTAQLSDQQSWWLDRTLAEFRRNGAQLSPDQQQRLRAINAELACLQDKFSQLVVAGRNAAAVHVTDAASLAGLSEAHLAEARAAAQTRGLDGWLLELVNTTQQAQLTELSFQAMRRTLFDASTNRDQTGDTDTRELICTIARLRAERASLLGFANFADYVASNGCAGGEPAVRILLDQMTAVAQKLADRDAEGYRGRFAMLAPGAQFEACDWQFMAAEERAQVAVDDAALRPYLEFERVLNEGVFAAANALYGITLQPRPDLVGYTPNCRVFEVHEADATLLGWVIVDPYARPTKQGGAWMTQLVAASSLTEEAPIVTLNLNLTRPVDGEAVLLGWDQVITVFHEFGHCLHGLFARSDYPSRSGANGPIDYIEFPSQVNEHWAWEPAFIARFARHYLTGEPIPAELVDKLRAGQKFDLGYESLETVAAQQLDQVWHTTPADQLPATPDGVAGFEAAALSARGASNALIPPRYRSTYFSHIWGNGYAAAYYAYLWAEVMDADTCAWFDEQGGATRQAGQQFRELVLAKGYGVDVMAAYRNFRGADPDLKYLVERRGAQA